MPDSAADTAMPDAQPLWAYVAMTTMIVALAALGLCLYTVDWFICSAKVQPQPSLMPGIVALVTCVAVMVAVGFGIACYEECMSVPWVPLLVEAALLGFVVVAWGMLARFANRWPSP